MSNFYKGRTYFIHEGANTYKIYIDQEHDPKGGTNKDLKIYIQKTNLMLQDNVGRGKEFTEINACKVLPTQTVRTKIVNIIH